MRRQMWKFPLAIGVNNVSVPAGAQFVTVSRDGGGQWCAYALVNADAVMRQPRTLHVVGTGHDIRDRAVHFLGTFNDGPFVWHVWSE